MDEFCVCSHKTLQKTDSAEMWTNARPWFTDVESRGQFAGGWCRPGLTLSTFQLNLSQFVVMPPKSSHKKSQKKVLTLSPLISLISSIFADSSLKPRTKRIAQIDLKKVLAMSRIVDTSVRPWCRRPDGSIHVEPSLYTREESKL